MNWKKPLVARKPDDWAVILFTSGTEGLPKGVVLSHRNVLSNVAQVEARIDYGREDKLFMALPAFHSFGFMGGIVLPLISGVPSYLYPSPLHYRTVPELVYGICATYMFGTDTFLAGYARMANPYDFRSLRYIVAGAEPIKETTRRIYLEKFGLRILEGYGVTETSPVLALNTPMFNKFGTVGRLLPGMQAKLEKVEGVEEGGRLYVKGPNVMLGYLRVDRPGVLEPPPEGWYDTGDIVTIDDQGYIAIKGRAKRFAKIGGEMISLAAVEMLAAELWPHYVSAVVAVADDRKGERLILVTDKHGATRADFIAYARSKHASELMFPAEIMVLDKLPLLGSGKPDLMALQKLVRTSWRRKRPRRSDFPIPSSARAAGLAADRAAAVRAYSRHRQKSCWLGFNRPSTDIVMRITIEIDDTLMAQAQKASGYVIKKQIAEESRRWMIRLRRRRDSSIAFAKYRWRGDLAKSRRGR